jgi:hypothetical protein
MTATGPKRTVASFLENATQMAYWTKTLAHWWGYIGSYVIMAILGNALLVFFVAEDDHGLFGLADHVISESGNPQSRYFLLALIFLGPLFNVYTTIVAIKSAGEADDDYHHSLSTLRHLPRPPAHARKRLIAILSFVPGLMLLPFTIWLYTAQVHWLWQIDVPFLVQPGLFLSIALILLAYTVVPKFFPQAVEVLYDLEDEVTDRFSDN